MFFPSRLIAKSKILPPLLQIPLFAMSQTRGCSEQIP